MTPGIPRPCGSRPSALTTATALLAASAALCAAPPPPPAATTPLAPAAAFERYCTGCHNDKVKTANFSLNTIDFTRAARTAEPAEKALRKLHAGMMPPPGLPRPDAATSRAMIDLLESQIDRAAQLQPNPGRPALHRLNRTEYSNAVRDLLALQFDSTTVLPPDDMSHGFDNMADVLTISPALLDGYVRAAGRIARDAIGDTGARAITHTYQVSRVYSQMRHVEGAPFGTRGGISVVHNFPADGDYVIKLGFYYSPTGPLFGLNQGKGQQIEVSVNGERAVMMDIDPRWTLAKDGFKTPPIHIKAGPQRISAAFPVQFDGPLEDEYRLVEQTLVDVSAGTVPGMTTLPHLHEMSITGPTKIDGVSETPSRKRIFTCRPKPDGSDEVACAKQIVSAIARQAYRRPLTPNDVEALLSFYQKGKNEGDFETGIRTALQAILASPDFVFRFERVPAGVAAGSNYRISDLEVASRLAFFLWSSAPDEELLTIASQNRLRDPATLEKQVKRMLADPRSEALTSNFAGQWLHLRNLRGASPDLMLYPDFDRTLSQSMRRETELLFSYIVREDHPVLEMLSADYTFVDERLAKHYGIADVVGNRFRKVPVTDPNRYGILGHAGILMLTSVANRTSPVMRGKYVMEVLLGTPPPAPPPNVPALKEAADLNTPRPVRQRLEEHRRNPNCAGCHKLMDPIGFALENFDAVGTWRVNDSGFSIDPNGVLYDGVKLDGPVGLRKALLNHSDSFLATFTENLLAYGLGRVIDYRDMPFVRTIARDAARGNNRMSSFILGIVKSPAFGTRRAEEPTSPAESSVSPVNER